jgi:hypothetical protein
VYKAANLIGAGGPTSVTRHPHCRLCRPGPNLPSSIQAATIQALLELVHAGAGEGSGSNGAVTIQGSGGRGYPPHNKLSGNPTQRTVLRGSLSNGRFDIVSVRHTVGNPIMMGTAGLVLRLAEQGQSRPSACFWAASGTLHVV